MYKTAGQLHKLLNVNAVILEIRKQMKFTLNHRSVMCVPRKSVKMHASGRLRVLNEIVN